MRCYQNHSPIKAKYLYAMHLPITSTVQYYHTQKQLELTEVQTRSIHYCTLISSGFIPNSNDPIKCSEKAYSFIENIFNHSGPFIPISLLVLPLLTFETI